MATANPAVIIGLGGTGQWALTYIKKNLIDTYGTVPDTVQLLAFDTTSDKSEASVESEEQEEKARIGDITLGSGEFVYLGGNIRNICEGVARRGEYAHIGSWLDAEHYLSSQDAAAFEISKGAGQRRPFGRMSVFYDLMQGNPLITGKIEQALTNVSTAAEKKRPVEIYIICSLAGGTGAGMFIDIAHLARVLAEKGKVPHAVRGFIVLQNTFNPVARINDAQPFAAMREMDRFMRVFDWDYPIYYTDDPTKRSLQTIYRKKLFDNCYLLDARRLTLPLDGVPPRYGVFPSVAECITVLLDPETGNTFDQHYKNVNERLANTQKELRKALYSSLGTYTYVLPVNDIIERNTLKLALELVRDRLVGFTRDDTGAIRLSSDQATEYSRSPREEAKEFLRMEQSRSNVRNLVYNQNLALMLEQPLEDLPIIQQMADYGVELLPWLTPTDQDESMVSAGRNIDTVLQTSLLSEIDTARESGEDFYDASNRIIKQIRAKRAALLGGEEAGGKRVAGQFEKGLSEYAERNRERFQELLTERLLLLLNGATDDQVEAKTAKLPYAQDFLRALIRAYQDFEDFIQSVIDYRAKEGYLAEARDFVATTRQTMQDTVTLTGMIDKMRGTHVKAEEAYIENEDYLLGLEREEMVLQAMLQLAGNLKDISNEAKQQVDSWVDALALGGEPGSGELGMYNELQTRQANLKRRREEQAKIKVYKYLTDETYEDDLYDSRIDTNRLQDILRKFEWRFATADSLDLKLFYHARTGASVDVPELARRAPKRDVSATKHNVELMVEHLRPYFWDIRDENIADRLADSLTAARVAKELLDNSGSLITYPGDSQGHEEKHNFVCCNQGGQVFYFQQVDDQLKKGAPNDKDNQVLGFSNKYRCTILSTLDLLIGQNVTPYRQSEQSYRNYPSDRRLMHIFPAEVNATRYERARTQPPLNEQFKLLSPEIVALLEDEELAKNFVLSLVYGLVREEEATEVRGNQYVLRLDTKTRTQRNLDPWKATLTGVSNQPDLLEAMENFVFVRIDQESGTRSINDQTPGMNIQISPERVAASLRFREESVIAGREAIVDEFVKYLSEGRLSGGKGRVSDTLTDEGARFLTGAYRAMLADNERALYRDEMDDINEAVAQMVLDNRDAYEARYRDELTASIQEFTARYKGGQGVESGDHGRLIDRLEEYISNVAVPMRKEGDSLRADLGVIMHLILWDEINRLERIRDSLAA